MIYYKKPHNYSSLKIKIMKTKILLSALLLSMSLIGFSITRQVTNVTGQLLFTPASLTINLGDDVNFTLELSHNAVEVSLATWQVNGITPITGFTVPFGGGLLPASQLPVGTHYYICAPHASYGMKGIIIVATATAIQETNDAANITVTPNPASNFMVITANDNNLIGSDYKLFDQIGRQLLTGRLNDKTTSVAVSRLNPGLYFVRVGELNSNIFKVFIK